MDTIQAMKNLKEKIESMEAVVSRTEDANAVRFHYSVILKAIDDAIAEAEHDLPEPCERCNTEGFGDSDGHPTICPDCEGSGYKKKEPLPLKDKGMGLCVAAKNVRMCFDPASNGFVCCEGNCPHGKDYYKGCYGGPGSLSGSMIERVIIGKTELYLCSNSDRCKLSTCSHMNPHEKDDCDRVGCPDGTGLGIRGSLCQRSHIVTNVQTNEPAGTAASKEDDKDKGA